MLYEKASTNYYVMELQKNNSWLPLPYKQWKETLDTLHMWMEIAGKVKLKLSPFVNQWWEVAFEVNARGLTTGRIPYKNKIFEIEFDFIVHKINIRLSDGREKSIVMQSGCVADFYAQFMSALNSLEIDVYIWPVPVEFSQTIPFAEDKIHCAYDRKAAFDWWQAQTKICMIFDQFRSTFRGKSSPVQFYWGSFDLNCTHFSGKLVEPPKMDGVIGRIMKYAENEENFAFGFWPGDERFPEPAFYSYVYPAPAGIEKIKLGSQIAAYNETLREFILPYDEVVKMENPEQEILNFLQTTYLESVKLAEWDWESFKTEKPF